MARYSDDHTDNTVRTGTFVGAVAVICVVLMAVVEKIF